MKKFIKKILVKSLKHKISSITINKNNSLVLKYKLFYPFTGRKLFVLKDRLSGRRIQKDLFNKSVSISFNELSEVTKDGKFDFYLKSYFLGRSILRRTPFNNSLQLSPYVDKKNKSKINLVKTKNKNLSLYAQTVDFYTEITDVKTIDAGFLLRGVLENLSDHNPNSLEAILIRRDTKSSWSYDLDLKRIESSQNTFLFEGALNIEELKDELVINSRWDLYLQLKNDDNIIVYKEQISMQGYKDFSMEEDRYLEVMTMEDDKISTLYATMGANSLALWYTDKSQFEKTYTIAKGKSVFNKTCEEGDIFDKMVFFESFFGKNYSGNPKYIYEEMLNDARFKNYTFVWSYSGSSPKNIPGNPILVNRESEEYYRYLARSKYWVSNIIFPVHRKREGNVYLQTWHGTPLKRLGFDIDIDGPEVLARENFYIESRNWDYLVSANAYSTEIFKRAFKFEKEVLEFGYPANDIFYRENLSNKVSYFKKKLNIPTHKKVILYAPTWRDNEMVHSWEHSFNLKFNLDRFFKELSGEYVLILRMHHLVSQALKIPEEYLSFVYDLSDYDDIQELYIISDILITDYSSVFFDFANSMKPMLFYAYDYELYKEKIRGFYFDMEEVLPGPVIQTEDELLQSILDIKEVQNKYKHKYQEFHKKFCGIEDGNAAKRVINKVFK